MPDDSGKAADNSLATQNGVATEVSRPVRAGTPELRWLIDQIGAEVLDRDRDRRAPHAEYALAKQHRLGALRVPAELGGGGCSIRELFETVIELAAADPDVAHSLRNHFLFVESRIRLASAGADDPLLALAVGGAIFGSSASEPGSPGIGRIAAGYDSRLTPDGDGYRLNGTKNYSTGNLYADYIVVSAEDPAGQLVQALVPAGRAGVAVDDDWDGIGQRLSGSGTTRFADVSVARSDLLDGSAAPGRRAPYSATYAQLWLTSVIAGILRRLVADAVDLVHGRSRTYYHAPDDHPSRDVLLQETMGYISAQAYVAEAAVLTASDRLEEAWAAVQAGAPDLQLSLAAALAAAKAKIVVDEIAQRAASMIFDVGGATAARQSSTGTGAISGPWPRTIPAATRPSGSATMSSTGRRCRPEPTSDHPSGLRSPVRPPRRTARASCPRRCRAARG
jgi:alkylation response protein AidB-like acyl-CoA dehydrogenase